MRQPARLRGVRRSRKALGLAVVNVIVLTAALTALEMAYRGLRYLRSCATQCDESALSSPLSQDAYGALRLARYDPLLGYVLRENLDVVIPASLAPAWHGARVSTDARGFRRNAEALPPGFPPAAPKVVATGDSFTFGDQVGNGETWPACLNEDASAAPVVNAGVFGYGAVQTLLRAESIMEDHLGRPALLLVGILVGESFDRDTLRYRSGFPKPALIRLGGNGLGLAPPPAGRDTGAKFEDAAAVPLLIRMARAVNNSSWLGRSLLGASAPFSRLLMKRRSEPHPDAAAPNEIMEWTFQRLASLSVPALVVLEYGPEMRPAVLDERLRILASLQRLKIAAVDTFSAIHGEGVDTALLYRSTGEHHSPLGNALVCTLIRKSPDFQRLVRREAAR